MQPDAPELFAWLTTEKAAALIAIIAAAGAYFFGGRKREKVDAASGQVSLTSTNDLLEELVGVLRGFSRQQADRSEVDHGVQVQIRDEIRLLRGAGGLQGDTKDNPPRRPRRKQAA